MITVHFTGNRRIHEIYEDELSIMWYELVKINLYSIAHKIKLNCTGRYEYQTLTIQQKEERINNFIRN